MTTISAEVVVDSVHYDGGHRLTTMQLRYPRCIHAEFMTHRVFSRNASSSRAVPVKRLIQDVLDDPYVPLYWGKNQRGMQAESECNEQVSSDHSGALVGFQLNREHAWTLAKNNAVVVARAFDEAGYHKQLVNRLLEPFSHINVVVTATEWANFFALRCHEDAEPHIRMLAEAMCDAYIGSAPQHLGVDEWHLPYVEDAVDWDSEVSVRNAIKYSAACCAGVSYKTVEGAPMDLDRAFAIYDKLVGSAPIHASPCEHQARPDFILSSGEGWFVWNKPELHGNFVGWVQYRKTLLNENVENTI